MISLFLSKLRLFMMVIALRVDLQVVCRWSSVSSCVLQSEQVSEWPLNLSLTLVGTAL